MAYKATTGAKTEVKICDSPALIIEGLQSWTTAGQTKPTSERANLGSSSRTLAVSNRAALGSCPGECDFDPIDPSQARIIELFKDATDTQIADWEVALSDNGSEALQFSGAVTALGLNFPNDASPVKMSFTVSPTTVPTVGVATTFTPSATFAPVQGEGTKLSMYVTSAYVQLNGPENISLQWGAKDTQTLPEMSQVTPAVNVVGIRGSCTGSFDLLYDSTETNQVAIRTAVGAANAAKKLKITCTDTGAAEIILDPVIFTGWEPSPIPGANRVKVSFVANCDLTVTP